MMDIHIALSQLHKETGCQYSLNGDDIDGLNWLSDGIPKPSLADLEAAYRRYQSDYSRLRESEYPSVQEQLDTLYHEGIDGWRAQVKAVKDKYPKPKQ